MEKEFERILKAFANRRRLAILRYLKKKGEAPVYDIAEQIKLSFKSTSRHLGVLASADILDKEQRGVEVYYRISDTMKSASKRILDIL